MKSMLIYLSDASVMIIHVYWFRKSCFMCWTTLYFRLSS